MAGLGLYGTGNWGLPEFGLTEKFGGNTGSTQYSNPVASSPQISTGGSVLGTTYGPAYSGQQQQPVSTGLYSGGGSSSGGSSNDYRSVQESTPEGPSQREVDQAFSPAIDALKNFQQSLQSQLSGGSPLQGESQLRSEAAGTQGILESGLQEKQAQFGQQRTREEGRTESAVAEARRQGSEMIQGLQSRFGGTTGTGAFVGELTGRQVMQNIAQNRTALQDTIMQINDAEASTEREVGRQLEALDSQLKSSVQELRNNVMQGIQQINLQRGELESEKSRKKLDILQNFRSAQAEVEARNTQFAQQLYMQLQQTKSQAQQFRGQANETFQTTNEALNKEGMTLTSAKLTEGGQPMYQWGRTEEGDNTGALPDVVTDIPNYVDPDKKN